MGSESETVIFNRFFLLFQQFNLTRIAKYERTYDGLELSKINEKWKEIWLSFVTIKYVEKDNGICCLCSWICSSKGKVIALPFIYWENNLLQVSMR